MAKYLIENDIFEDITGMLENSHEIPESASQGLLILENILERVKQDSLDMKEFPIDTLEGKLPNLEWFD